ncbi:MAG TPA: hypothetical protein VHE30_07140 [Polyangiaceae bacterium]|nr:hypothetical protein [Polyangiaceae bacterium]
MSIRSGAALPALFVLVSGCTPATARWPEPGIAKVTARTSAELSDRELVERIPVCVGSRGWSAGSLGSTALFRVESTPSTVKVGYFVHWSTERPWGANVLSFTVVPALLTDAFYSHFLYVFPGAKDALYGPDDIEGVEVEFARAPDGALRVTGGTADDAEHDPIRLTKDDLVDSRGRLVLLTDAWSHQLGAHGAARFATEPGNELTCYQGTSLKPLTREIAVAFRLGDERHPLRAKPAWGPHEAPREDVAKARAPSGM